RWSLDDLVTAWFGAELLRESPPGRFVDLGCGIGTVLLLTAWRFPEALGLGIEAQQQSADLARRSIAWNGVESRCRVRCADLREPASLFGEEACDLVTATPPYLPLGSAHSSTRPQRAGCHLEQRGGVEDFTQAAARLLAPQGPRWSASPAEPREPGSPWYGGWTSCRARARTCCSRCGRCAGAITPVGSGSIGRSSSVTGWNAGRSSSARCGPGWACRREAAGGAPLVYSCAPWLRVTRLAPSAAASPASTSARRSARWRCVATACPRRATHPATSPAPAR